ncbi:MAG: hypothetical protein Q8P20_07240 [bacterium]|nr:hypothetical protein [bacterium]
MKKFKKIFLYSFGGLLDLIPKKINAITATELPNPLYGIQPIEELTFWEKVLSVIGSPIFLIIIAGLAIVTIVIGVILLIKKK